MYERFFQKLNESVALTGAEQEIITRYLQHKKLRKKQYLLQAGDVCKAIAFVENGALREYSVDENGNEHILQFALEGWLISDLYSFMTAEPATYNIDALEDCELVLLTKSAQDEILKQVPKFETYTTMQITGAYLAMQKRVNAMISLSPEHRYQNFINLYPNIARRVPQHMIASYLGLSPETLSRIRKRLATAH
ncbi:Crp/Fnr family transcriptional regulator [Mucilaginibacter gotjawali]|uniref:CRP-like cAMP-binding protein n=1 Tax=Mucilaginibacter gotjawali TaxID=1550579 RepID=A0A839SEM5_9SPHI|nr:Crp/Fnr family transcriptional regulator [Mucilaginibacter gotjawali]MBB3056691.1 CRP-like cAMP-binding protein [Mucilaginibacter gotjawali]